MHTLRKKAVIYTCITGNYDQLNNHSYIHSDWDYVCFTDDISVKNNHNSNWEIKPLVFNEMDNVRKTDGINCTRICYSRNMKEAFMSTVMLTCSMMKYLPTLISLSENPGKFPWRPHFSRKCIYDELSACLKFEKDDPEIMKEQINLMRKEGFPKNYCFFENNII